MSSCSPFRSGGLKNDPGLCSEWELCNWVFRLAVLLFPPFPMGRSRISVFVVCLESAYQERAENQGKIQKIFIRSVYKKFLDLVKSFLCKAFIKKFLRPLILWERMICWWKAWRAGRYMGDAHREWRKRCAVWRKTYHAGKVKHTARYPQWNFQA